MSGISFEQLRVELLRERTKEERRAVVAKYARKRKNGSIVFCCPTREEIEAGFGEESWGNNGKVIYDTADIAYQARKELELLGNPRQRVYECHRSKHGHVHLTSKKK